MKTINNVNIKRGDIWLYTADFNIDESLNSTRKIDIEIPDIKYLANHGGVVVVLAHKGRYTDKPSGLNFTIRYIEKKQKTKVKYFPENNTINAINFVKGLNPGEICILGNTRQNMGEELNDEVLAYQYSKLGNFVALGGFSKSHRKNASNYGILHYLPGYITNSHLNEINLLERWLANNNKYSVAVLGGVKEEKITLGLNCCKDYKAIIPGGAVLNSILKARGYSVGSSVLYDDIDLTNYSYNVILPDKLIIANGENRNEVKQIKIGENVPDNYIIVDFILSSIGIGFLEEAINQRGRILIAGTPSLTKWGFNNATSTISAFIKKIDSLILGEDTASDLNFGNFGHNINISTGGGAALYYLTHKTTPILEALKWKKRQ